MTSVKIPRNEANEPKSLKKLSKHYPRNSTMKKNMKTTKKCPKCENTKLVHLTSMNLKVCTNHKEFVKIPWYLGENQKPIF